MRIFPRDTPIEAGATVAVLARLSGLWSLNACRVVYRIESEEGGVRRYGFAYGTLPAHAARGEERFIVEWDRESGAVHYDLFAFSRPNHPLLWAGHPFARALQRRFARDSLRKYTLGVVGLRGHSASGLPKLLDCSVVIP